MNKVDMYAILDIKIDAMQKLAQESIELIFNAGYNDGLEAAAKKCEDNWANAEAAIIRQELKK